MILSDSQKKELSKKLDKLITLPGWAEPFDRIILNFGLNYLDDNFGDKIPEKFRDDISKVVDCFLIDDYAGIVEVIPEVLNEIVNIPGLDEDLEGKFFAINLKASFEFIEYLAQKNKK